MSDLQPPAPPGRWPDLPAPSSWTPAPEGGPPGLPPPGSIPRSVPRDRVGLHLVLLVLTFLSTWAIGRLHYEAFLLDFVPRQLLFVTPAQLWIGGLWYSLPLMAILLAHEMGHYLACRRYRVPASLPYFLPFPFSFVGTLGAFIRIRGHFLDRRSLFDMAVAGPIAGFLVALPAMVAGLALSRVARVPDDFVGLELGEPLLFQAISHAIFGPIPENHSVNLHPMALAAWFGLLVTALNLMPAGQLDGGHISYAVFGRASSRITIATVVVLGLLALHSTSWLLWALLLLVMLRLFGLHHPPVRHDDVALDRGRLLVAALALLIFVACFTPAPIQPYELVRPR